jgi:transposase
MANRSFEMYQYRQIIQRLRLGESDRAIARAEGVGRVKVACLRELANERGWLGSTSPLPDDATLSAALSAPRRTPQNLSTVEPFREQLLAWHAQGIQTTTMHRALVRNHGYTGSVYALYRFLDREGQSTPQATVILEFAVGESAQVDFGQGPVITDRRTGEVTKTWIFVMTLAWSRHQYAEIVRNQKVETWLACHRHAFEWLNGCPQSVRIDNPKCAITRACYYEPEVQRSYGQLALGYSFRIDPCPVRDPKKKGRVESGVKFIKSGFVPLREFHSLEHANEQLRAWILEEAGNRIHGTTRERPLALFTQTEQAMLQPLPAIAPECPVWAKAKLHGNCHVQFEYCYYSAPFQLIGQELWLEIAPSAVRIYRDHELVAVHPRLFKSGTKSTVQDHLPPDAVAFLMRDPQWCLAQATAVGPACRTLVETLFSNRVLDHLRAAQGLLRLGESFGSTRLEAACARALNFGAPTYRTVKQILKDGFDQQPELIEVAGLEAPYLGGGHFSRKPSDPLH